MKLNIIIIALVLGGTSLFWGNIYLGLITTALFLYQIYKDEKTKKKTKIEDVNIRI